MLVETKEFKIESLVSGGIINTYLCSSRCRHCLYHCDSSWKNDFISEEVSSEIMRDLKRMRSSSVHIGGGEPFLNRASLKSVLEQAFFGGINIEYVETNSSWFNDLKKACEILIDLKESGLKTLLISISPFHNEYIPFYKVKGVIKACEETGVDVFPWVLDFYQDLNAFDDTKTHSLEEYKQKFGDDYIKKIPSRYWIHYGGRALKLFEPFFKKKTCSEIIEKDSCGCSELINTEHFHIDLYGNYIPGLCSGISIDCNDLGEIFQPEKYPLLSLLFYKGIGALSEYAQKEYDFRPKKYYLSKCEFCLDIRRFLVIEKRKTFREIEPVEFYKHCA